VSITCFNTKGAVNLAMIGLAAVSLAACQSRPKPGPSTAPPPTMAPPPESPPAPPPPPVSQGPLPGSVQDFVINAGDRVYFDFDSFELRTDARPVLDAQAGWLQRYPGVAVRIEGNADERGTREYNLALGARRSNSIRDYLVAQGIAASRISTVSYGKEQPIDPGATEDAYQRNRNGHTAITSGAR
jgi:peptidoglycan-associated lipoprotein